jgi:hypothetical protein
LRKNFREAWFSTKHNIEYSLCSVCLCHSWVTRKKPCV